VSNGVKTVRQILSENLDALQQRYLTLEAEHTAAMAEIGRHHELIRELRDELTWLLDGDVFTAQAWNDVEFVDALRLAALRELLNREVG
jgi:hypothetical protein